MKRTVSSAAAASAPQRIDQVIGSLADWRGETLARVRALIHAALPDVVEEWKWDVPVWSRDGIICTGETYRTAVKLTFPKGASIADPAGLFNASLAGNARRAIDIREGETLKATAFKALVKAAAAANAAPRQKTSRSSPTRTTAATRRGGATGASGAKTATAPEGSTGVRLLSGGNPQIAKGDGDAPVQAYIAAVPDWRQDVCRWLDEVIVRTCPDVRKAVKWNSPFYGIEGQGWFLSFHVFTRYVKVTFFKGAQLKPLPPGASKDAQVRYLDIHEADARDEQQFSKWVTQAARLPGWLT